MKKRILIVDDEKDICFLISEILKDENYHTFNCHTYDDAIKYFNTDDYDLVILDVWLDKNKTEGLELLKYFKKQNKFIPIIMISGHSTIDVAVQAIKEGAYDFIEKPFESNKLLILTKRAIENSNLLKENLELKELNVKNYELIGNSNFITTLKKTLNKISSSSRVLISGPLGSGKETIAHNIHENSSRKNKPFIVFNCNLINPDLIEEILFGSIISKKIGIIEKANGGTILLNEIGDLSINIQNLILKYLQNNTFKKINSDNIIHSDTRIISTSSKDLEFKCNNGSFISDLYQRIKVIEIKIPPLNKRPEDIKPLCEYFIKISQFFNNQKIQITEDSFAILESYSWPGNTRQLRNLIDRLLIMHGEKSNEIVIDSAKLPDDMGEINIENSQVKYDVLGLPIKDAREIFEKNYLLSQIKRFNGNISKVASFVGMERTALYRKLKSLDINIET